MDLYTYGTYFIFYFGGKCVTASAAFCLFPPKFSYKFTIKCTVKVKDAIFIRKKGEEEYYHMYVRISEKNVFARSK